MTSTTEERLLKEIEKELKKGIERNNILPLDWAMDRINPLIKEAIRQTKAECYKQARSEYEAQVPAIVDVTRQECRDKFKEMIVRLDREVYDSSKVGNRINLMLAHEFAEKLLQKADEVLK